MIAGKQPEQQSGISHLGVQQSASRGEFPSSRNGSTATMPTRLVSSGSEPWSDAVVRLLDVFVIQACLCVMFSGLQSDAVCSICVYAS